jgi:hypothetical protein
VRQGHLGWFELQSFVAQIPDDEPWLEAICTPAFTFGFRRGELTFMKGRASGLGPESDYPASG